ncbi:hypothetical protein FJZ53_05050 [Candidatus Woesearchaeota archaeon]|nr:hypothetical protein [Candidatus Woesearchaeota archaeon]
MKVPKTFIPEKDLGNNIEQLLQGRKVQPGGIVFSYDDLFNGGGIFKELAQVILDQAIDEKDREKYLRELKVAKDLYKENIKVYLQI